MPPKRNSMADPSTSDKTPSKSRAENNETIDNSHYKTSGPVFEGPNGAFTANAWIKMYKIYSKRLGWSTGTRTENIALYLKGAALKWFCSTVLENKEPEQVNWEEFENALKERFHQRSQDPLASWINFRLEANSDVRSYFEEKVELGNLAGQTTINQISALTLGLPNKYRTAFATTAGKIASLHEWLAIAQKLEEGYKRERLFGGNAKDKAPRDSGVKSSASNQTGKPPACKICERLGMNNQFHWHRDCANRKPAIANIGEQGNEEGNLGSYDSEQL